MPKFPEEAPVPNANKSVNKSRKSNNAFVFILLKIFVNPNLKINRIVKISKKRDSILLMNMNKFLDSHK